MSNICDIFVSFESTLSRSRGRFPRKITVRLTYGGGQSLTRWAYPGQTFHFLLEGSPALEKLELLQRGQVLDGCTGLS